MDKKRHGELDILRGIAMLFIIWGHMPLPKEQIIYAYSFHIPLFFVISGMTYNLSKKITFRHFIIKKAKQLMVPYFLWQAILIPLWIFNWKILSSSKQPNFNLIKGILYSNEKVITAPSNALWFLPTLFLVCIIYYKIDEICKGDKKQLAIMALISSCIGYVISLEKVEIQYPWHVATIPVALAFFFIGHYLMLHIDGIQMFLHQASLWVKGCAIVAMLAAGWGVSLWNGKVSLANISYGSYILFFTASLCSIFAYCQIANQVKHLLLLTSILRFVGTNTLVFVALHCPILRTIQNYSAQANALASTYPTICGLLIAILICPIGLFINKFIPVLNGKNKNTFEKSGMRAGF